MFAMISYSFTLMNYYNWWIASEADGMESLPLQKRLIYSTPSRQRMFFWLRFF